LSRIKLGELAHARWKSRARNSRSQETRFCDRISSLFTQCDSSRRKAMTSHLESQVGPMGWGINMHTTCRSPWLIVYIEVYIGLLTFEH